MPANLFFRFEGDRVAEIRAVEDWSAVLCDIGYFTSPFQRYLSRQAIA